MIKLVFGSKNKIVKLERQDFSALRTLIRQSFSDVPSDYTLSYVDSDKDEICLNSDEDLLIMLSAGAKVNKVYVKQSLSQTIEITDRIEPSFEVEETASKVVEVVEEKVINEQLFKKKEEKVEYEFVEAKVEKEEKEIQKQPIVQTIEKEQIKEEVEQKVEAQVKPEVVEPVVIEAVEIKQEEKPVNKSFIVSVSDITKVEIEESQLKQKIEDIVKRVIQSKVEVKKDKDLQVKKEQVKEEKKVLHEEPKPKVEELHKLEVRAPSYSELIYHNVICSSCKDQYGIIGIRYQCIFCDNFNLCQTCEAKIDHQHALLKVKQPKQEVKKDAIIAKYRNEIVKDRIPAGHYIPSISKDEANRFIDTSKNMINDSLASAQRMLNDMFMKLQLSHQNPYEVARPAVGLPKYYPEVEKPAPPIVEPNKIIKQKTDYLCDFFNITERQARHFISRYQGFTKEQLAAVYIELKEKK